MAKGLQDLAKAYASDRLPGDLPAVKNLRYALNVAACDRRPVAIVRDAETAAKWAWQPRYQGQFVWTVDSSAKDELKILQPMNTGERHRPRRRIPRRSHP